jgi:hypothetical protein
VVTVRVAGTLDLADALDLDDAISTGAQTLADLGCEESVDARRSTAAGELARGQGPLDFPATPRRQVVLNAPTDGGPFARLDNIRSLHSLDQVRDWCDAASVHVRQVIDLNEHRWNEGHDPTALLREQVVLTHPTCVFPNCTRPSRSCDCGHIIEPERGGPTCSCNLAPLCRFDHRLKTHGGWPTNAPDPAPSAGPAPTDTSTSATTKTADISDDQTHAQVPAGSGAPASRPPSATWATWCGDATTGCRWPCAAQFEGVS